MPPTTDPWTTPPIIERFDNWTGELSNDWRFGTLSSPTTAMYLKEIDVSATYLSGSEVTSGTVQTSRTISAMIGGEEFVLRWKVLQDGKTQVKQTMIRVLKSGSVR